MLALQVCLRICDYWGTQIDGQHAEAIFSQTLVQLLCSCAPLLFSHCVLLHSTLLLLKELKEFLEHGFSVALHWGCRQWAQSDPFPVFPLLGVLLNVSTATLPHGPVPCTQSRFDQVPLTGARRLCPEAVLKHLFSRWPKDSARVTGYAQGMKLSTAPFT